MEHERSREKLAGTLLLLTLVSSLAAVVFATRVGTDYNVPRGEVADVLKLVAENAAAHQLEIAFDFLSFVFLVALAAALHLVFGARAPGLAALGGAALAAGGIILAVHDMAWFVLPTVAADYVSASGIRAEMLEDIGNVLMLTANWGLSAGITFMGVGLFLFGLLVIRARPVPVWLGWLGALAGVLLAFGTWLPRVDPELYMIWTALSAPVLLWEIGLGVWLLVKGTRPA